MGVMKAMSVYPGCLEQREFGSCWIRGLVLNAVHGVGKWRLMLLVQIATSNDEEPILRTPGETYSENAQYKGFASLYKSPSLL